PPHLYTNVASTARRIFGRLCKKTFATISANTRLLRCSRTPLLDHLRGAQQKRFRNRQADGLGGAKIDDEIELGWLLDRDVSRHCSLQNLVNKVGTSIPEVAHVRPISDQSSSLRELGCAD